MDLPAEPAPALARIRAAQQKPVTTQQKPVTLQKPVSTTTSTTTRIVTKPSEFRLFHFQQTQFFIALLVPVLYY